MTQQFKASEEEWEQMRSYVAAHAQELYQKYGKNYILITSEGQVLDSDANKFRLARRDVPRRGFVISAYRTLNPIEHELPSPEVESR